MPHALARRCRVSALLEKSQGGDRRSNGRTSGSLKPTKAKALREAGISKTQAGAAEELAGGKTQQERARPSALKLAIAIDARQTSSQPQNLGDGECARVIGPLGGGKNYSLVVRVLDLDRVTAAPGTTV
jgi:hypothetical protein